MTGLLLAVLGGLGVFYLYTAFAFGWRGVQPGPDQRALRVQRRKGLEDWLVQAGLEDVDTRQFLAAVAVLFALGAAVGYTIFGGTAASVVLGSFAASMPITSYRHKRSRRRSQAHDAWPRMIEEIRVLAGAAGRDGDIDAALAAGRAAFEATSNFDAAALEMQISGAFVRCGRITVVTTFEVPAISVPFGGGWGSGFEVTASHSELVDPYRSGLPGPADCG